MIRIIIWIVALVVMIAINGLFADRMQKIVEAKGSEERYWAWCFWIPLLGALMVIALPDKSNKIELNNNEELPLL